MERVAGKGVKVIANAGGVNPLACAAEIRRHCPSLRVAVVLGDDILGRVRDFALCNLDTGELLETVIEHVLSANVYTGAFGIVEALKAKPDVVVTGRCADAALVLAPMVFEFGWSETDWDLLAAGIVAGHIVECGAQCTGGNCLEDWETIPNLARVGYPIVEAEADGTCVITKHVGSGGKVTLGSVKEQLVY